MREKGDNFETVCEPAVWRRAIVQAIKDANCSQTDAVSRDKAAEALDWLEGKIKSFVTLKEACKFAGLDHVKVRAYVRSVVPALATPVVPALATPVEMPAAKACIVILKPERDGQRQQQRRSDTRFYEFDGKCQTLSGWARDIGLSYATLSTRIRMGWSLERVLTEGKCVERKSITFDGRTQSLKAWSRETGIDYHLLKWRLKNGWPVARALTQPVRSIQRVKQRDRGVGRKLSENAPDRLPPVAA